MGDFFSMSFVTEARVRVQAFFRCHDFEDHATLGHTPLIQFPNAYQKQCLLGWMSAALVMLKTR